MPDDLGDYDAEVERRMSELDLEGLFNSDSMTDQDVAIREGLKAQGVEDPFRGPLACLFANHRVLLQELRAKMAEVAESAKQINLRAGVLVIGYAGGGRLRKWLVKRAWKRIAEFHNISLSDLLGDMPKGHCADHWECKHDPAVDCDEVAEERRGLEQARYVVKEATGGGQSNKAFLELVDHAQGMTEGRENLEAALESRRPAEDQSTFFEVDNGCDKFKEPHPGLGSRFHELIEQRDEEARRPRPFPQPAPARVLK